MNNNSGFFDHSVSKINHRSQTITGPTYICKIYRCGHKSVTGTAYCECHTSPLRTGLAPFQYGSAPIVHVTNANIKDRK